MAGECEFTQCHFCQIPTSVSGLSRNHQPKSTVSMICHTIQRNILSDILYSIMHVMFETAEHLTLTDVIRLERSLRSFACLTKGDTIAIPYNKKVRVDE